MRHFCGLLRLRVVDRGLLWKMGCVGVWDECGGYCGIWRWVFGVVFMGGEGVIFRSGMCAADCELGVWMACKSAKMHSIDFSVSVKINLIPPLLIC